MAKKDSLNYSNLAACKSSAKTDAERRRCESKFSAKKTSRKQIPLNKREQEIWSRYMQEGSLRMTGQDSVLLDQILKDKMSGL